MVSYCLTNRAKADLQRIYLYGLENYGEKRADIYQEDLIKKFEYISQNPLSYQVVDIIGTHYRRAVCGIDNIYYKVVDGENIVEIIAIIGKQEVDGIF